MLLFLAFRFLFYIFNRELFPDLTSEQWIKILKGGFVFDLSALFYVNAIYVLMQLIPFKFRYNKGYQKVAKIVFFITNGLAFLVNGIDIIYYKFSLRRSTLAVLDEFKNENHKGKFFLEFIIDYWYITVIFI